MNLLRLAALTLCLSLLSACGASTQSCSAHCDCQQTTAPDKCTGEWACVEGTCQYQCRSQCKELPYTCGTDQSCNGSICSVRSCGV